LLVDFEESKTLSAQYPKELNALGDYLRKRRLDLGLLQRDVAERIAVDDGTLTEYVYSESSRPAARFANGNSTILNGRENGLE
jgi:transcriptional regulator with XRE-family HTH domain